MKKRNLGRRILSLVLTFTILQLLAPDNALLAQETESTPVIDVVEEGIKLSSELQGEAPTNGSCGDNLTWSYVASTGTLTISGTGAMYDYDDQRVFDNGYVGSFNNSPWKNYADNIKQVYLPQGITHIGAFSFYMCGELNEVLIPDGVESIGNGAFSTCMNLSHIVIPSTVKTIGDGYLNQSQYGVFNSPKLLTAGPKGGGYNIEFGWDIEIPDYAFANSMNGISSVILPSTIKTIGQYAFYSCYNLEEISFPNGLESIGDEAFCCCQKIRELIIPDGVSLGMSTFSACTSLKHLVIPGNVILPNFYGVLGNNPEIKTVGPIGGGFDLEYGYDTVFQMRLVPESAEYVQIPETVTKIIGEKVYRKKLLTAGPIGSGANIEYGWKEVIPDNAFEYFGSIRTVYFPNSIISIGDSAFSGCTDLENVVFPDGLKSIGNSAFAGCTSMKQVSIPGNVESLISAFSGCTGLTSVELNQGTKVMSDTFYGCTSLEELGLPDGLEQFDMSVVANTGIKTIIIPNSVDICSQNSRMYENDTCALESVCFEEGTTCIPSGMLRLKNGVKGSPTALYIPLSVKKIEEGAIINCVENGLTDIYYEGTVSQWNDIFIDDSYVYLYPEYKQNDDLNKCTFHFQYSFEPVYTVRFETNGGSQKAAQKIKSGSTVAMPIAPTRVGYTFAGWYLDEALTELYDFDAPVMSSFTLYAKWAEEVVDDSSAENAIKTKNIHYNSWLADDGKRDVSMDIKWGWNLFRNSAEYYNNDLAISSLILARSAETGQDNAESIMKTFGFDTNGNKKAVYSFNYEKPWYQIASPATTFGYKKIKLSNQDANVFVVVVRGTDGWSDILTDASSILNGFEVSEKYIKSELEGFMVSQTGNTLEALKAQRNIFWITGHSLGGAEANLLAADLREYAADKSVFAYTFASPNTCSSKNSYDNIYNILNKEDMVPLLKTNLRYRNGNDIWFDREQSGVKSKIYTTFYSLTGEKSLLDIMTRFSRTNNVFLLGGVVECAHATDTYMSYLLSCGDARETWKYKIRCAAVKCPVDVEIYSSQGALLGRIKDNKIDESVDTFVIFEIINDEKYIYMPYEGDYVFRLTGTDVGTMEFSLGEMDLESSETEEKKIFQDVILTEKKEMEATLASNSDEEGVKLYSIDEETGEKEKEILQNGVEIDYDPSEDPDYRGMIITGFRTVATKKTIQLKAEPVPSDAAKKKVKWESSDSKVAKVDASGRVTGVSAGTARITATAQDGSGVSAYRDVTVTTAAEQVLIRQGETGVTGQTLGLDPDVTEKSTLALSAELLAKQPDGTYSKTGVSQEVVWKSSAPKVAEVSQDGIVTACTVGTATITATAADGTNKSARVTINVSRLVSTIAISGESQVAAGKTVTLTASALPDSAKNKTVVWTSSDTAKATVSNGRVTAKKDASGTVTITATAKDGSGTSASYEMTIKKPAEKGIIKQGESDVTGGTIGIDLDDGTPVTLSAVFSAKKADGSYGTDGVSQSVTWKSSAPKVAVVEADGTVTALSAGKSIITATAGDGSGKNARVTVNVARLVSAITISGENEIGLGKSVTLTAAAAPDSAANKKVTWTSSNKSIADVAASTGRVTGKGIGFATITATATDGSGVSSSYEVTVKALTDSVIIKKGDDVVSKTILKQDLSDRNTIALFAVCKGKAEGDAVSQRVTWKSSKPAAATVAPDGTVTLLSPGKVDITATAADGSGKSAKVTLDVTQSAVTITGADKVAAGKSVKLTAQGPKVKWSIVNVTPALSKVTDASVNTSGTLNVKNTVAPGTVITVRATEDNNKKSEEERKTATHVVTVQKNDLKATVRIKQNGENVTGGTIGIDRDTMVPVTLRAEVVDAGGSTEDMSQNVVWKSSAPKVATVDADGTVTPLLAGTTKLTATTTDGTNKSGSVTINVASLAESVTVTAAGNASVLAAGKALQLTAAASPKRTAGKKFQWTAVADYSGIAGFDETTLPKNAVSISTAGRLSVNAKVPVGTVIRVRAEALDGSGSISDPYIVTIKKASGRVEIYQKSDTEYTTNLAGRKVGIDRDTLGTVNLKARVYEEAKTGTTVTNISQEVVWTSSNAKVATVVNGEVTAHAAGTATIKATTADGMNKSASVTINVASMVNTISLTGSSTIRRNAKTAASEKYAVSVTPVRSADKKVTWALSYQLPLGSTAAIKPTDIKVSNGTLTISKAVPTGTVITLEATAVDGSFARATKEVTVTE